MLFEKPLQTTSSRKDDEVPSPPLRLSCLFLCLLSFGLRGKRPINSLFFQIISAVLDDRTKDKISFLSKKEAEAKLTGLISPSALPAALPGGLDDFNYSNEEYLSLP